MALLLLSLALGAAELPGQVAAAGGGTSAAGPYAADATLGQPVAGAAAAGAAAATAGFWNTPAVAPTVPLIQILAQPGQLLRLSATNLLSSATDDDGDSLTVVAVSGSSQRGGSVLLEGERVLYTAPLYGLGFDTFTLTVIDSGGDSAVGTVRANVRAKVGTLIRVKRVL